jgi:hypothetical protein
MVEKGRAGVKRIITSAANTTPINQVPCLPIL